MFEAALKVAEAFAPSRIEDVHHSMAQMETFDPKNLKSITDAHLSDVIKKAKIYENARLFDKALEIYLSVDIDTTTNVDLLRNVLSSILRL